MRFRDRLYQFMQGRYGPDPVSYTHLDVYKRQIQQVRRFLFQLSDLHRMNAVFIQCFGSSHGRVYLIADLLEPRCV